jgi:hypothetical protein
MLLPKPDVVGCLFLPSSLLVEEVLWFAEFWEYDVSVPAKLFRSVGFGSIIA